MTTHPVEGTLFELELQKLANVSRRSPSPLSTDSTSKVAAPAIVVIIYFICPERVAFVAVRCGLPAFSGFQVPFMRQSMLYGY